MSACAGDSGVSIELRWPVPALAPDTAAITEVSLLRIDAAGETSQIVRQRSAEDAYLDMGTIEPGIDVRLSVEMRSPDRRLIGYARTEPAIDLQPGSTIPVNLRRPFVYLAGGPAVLAVDTTRGPGAEPYQHELAAAPMPLAVAVTPDASRLVVAAAAGAAPGGTAPWALHLLDTGDHQTLMHAAIGRSSSLGPPGELALSGDGMLAAVAHQGAGGGISVIHLERQGSEAVRSLMLGDVQHVAIGPAPDGTPRIAALQDASRACDGVPSRVHVIPLPMDDAAPPGMGGTGDIPADAGTVITYTGRLRDLAVLPEWRDLPESADLGTIVVADGCTGKVLRVDEGTGTLVELITVPGVHALAVRDSHLWAAGSRLPASDGSTDAALVLVGVDLRTGGLLGEIALPLSQELLLASTGTRSNVNARELHAREISVLPDMRHVALTSVAAYEPQGQGGVQIPGARTHEYLLVDTAAVAIVQRLRTSCEILASNGPARDWQCTESPGQSATTARFVPSSLAALYGGQ